ncbi:hypothetical protein K4L44_09705 [Halosquirtibacter laminarini]|uniref:Uncharacterized protein n=1 Tax=Halosquirtibacter laminarini TaxID=3374600 RepID=A0AC61NBL1_9BACT|nr:hypothetical protein K4L44_09705 [Prolixibacteraceae bacterium]
MKKLTLILVVSLFSFIGVVQAQTYADTQAYSLNEDTGNLFFIDYTIAFPSKNISDFVDPTSYRGFSMDFRHLLSDNFSVGFTTGFQSFYEDKGVKDTYMNDATLHGHTYHYLYSVPIFVNGHYYMNMDGKLKPFVGIGIGTIYNNMETRVGGISEDNKYWQFAIAPEIGLMYKVNDYMGAQVRGTADMAFESGDYDSGTYYRLHIGLYYNF